jgi:hypothetical protein
MQIYLIKKGDLWFHIKVENEPENERYVRNLKNIAYHEKLKLKDEKSDSPKKNKKKEVKESKGKKKKDKKLKNKNRK